MHGISNTQKSQDPRQVKTKHVNIDDPETNAGKPRRKPYNWIRTRPSINRDVDRSPARQFKPRASLLTSISRFIRVIPQLPSRGGCGARAISSCCRVVAIANRPLSEGTSAGEAVPLLCRETSGRFNYYRSAFEGRDGLKCLLPGVIRTSFSFLAGK